MDSRFSILKLKKHRFFFDAVFFYPFCGVKTPTNSKRELAGH